MIQQWLVTALLDILLPVLLDVLQEQPAAATGTVAADAEDFRALTAAAVIANVMQLVLEYLPQLVAVIE